QGAGNGDLGAAAAGVAHRHRVAGAEAHPPVVRERLTGRDQDGDVGRHVQRRTERHGEAAGEHIGQVRGVCPDQVEVELTATGEGGRVDLDLVEADVASQGRDIV